MLSQFRAALVERSVWGPALEEVLEKGPSFDQLHGEEPQLAVGQKLVESFERNDTCRHFQDQLNDTARNIVLNRAVVRILEFKCGEEPIRNLLGRTVAEGIGSARRF